MAGEVPLRDGIARVLDSWEELVARGEMSKQSFGRFGQLLHRFEHFAGARGVSKFDGVAPAVAAGFIDAHGRTRHGHVAPAALATRYLRRSVLRMCFTTARELRLTDADPTWGIELPPRVKSGTRPLSDDEAIALRRAAEYVERPTRHAAAAALALAGGFSGEIGHIRSADLDLTGHRVWMHGSTKTLPRWCSLDTWGMRVLIARTRHLENIAVGGLSPLAVSAQAGSDEQVQARVCVALRDLLKRIGLGADSSVRPASVTAYAGWETFTRTGRIEAAARHLGLASLDSTAALIGHYWQPTTTEREAGHDAR
ncbi:hypothetical protein J7F03_33105 [Streptomyces sp. ISL-43]|uniref:hypothetical protein n=1 Tax=Streptomyces sp. ISL-43 TaxID=2819183 RepID=UPI001BE59832|nr:hypothetical protein [Streptomyces sp. ISL-43]MBT2451819.1 hypothetical protein [Streptomyces sp. ISL-43]